MTQWINGLRVYRRTSSIRSPRNIGLSPTPTRRPQGQQQVGNQPTSPQTRPGLTGRNTSEPPDWISRPLSSSGNPVHSPGESALVASAPLEDWKDWLTYHTIEQRADILPKAFADEHFAFWDKTLNGVSQQLPRWRRGVRLVHGELGSELGRLYVKRYFPPEVKAQIQAMVTNLIAVYRNRLNRITWMAPATKAEAIAKLDNLYVGIGYAEHWDEDNFEVKPDDVVGNRWRSRLARYQHERSLLGTVVDRERWVMSPETINAVNLPLQNGLNFPAAILQAPSFNAHAPAAANYGAIGAVIGHEISHTFDSEGSAFDSKGRLRNWWTPEDFAHFNAVTQQGSTCTIRHLQAVSRSVIERQADPCREHRGRCGSRCSVQRLQGFASRPARS